MGIARIPGRVMLDGIALLRAATWTFERFSLEHVAREILGRGKLIVEPEDRLGEIRRLYAEDKAQLAAYNLEDCRLVADIFAKMDLIGFAVERTRLTGLALDRQGGSVAAFDFRYLPLLHRRGYIAKDVGDGPGGLGSPGGYVLDSQPGLYENVLVFDFKSLYPSIIRTFRIDPLGMALGDETGVPGFKGARFSRTESILPDLIAEMHEAREKAKREQNTALSQAIKIMMNSFYGVLGTPGCRFYDPALASSVTTRGHEIIMRTRDFIEAKGYRVIYGDTDSVFVHAGAEKSEAECRAFGEGLAQDLNAWWREAIRSEHDLESYLEIVFETHYLKFLMPTIRGSEEGTKKRYAGLVRKSEEQFKVTVRGLEAVRTDWTPLARSFQLELFRRVFLGEPFEEYVREVAAAVLRGEHDRELMYRKRIRRPLEAYRNPGPPHVQAARKTGRASRWISYAITLNGPEPAGAVRSTMDYGHYLERQLAPAADTILQFLGVTFEGLTARQLELFT
jgi:DNA polymerase-2